MLVFDNESIRIHRLTGGILKANCFVVETRPFSFVIDPCVETACLLRYLSERRIRPAISLATHAHFDHIGAAQFLIRSGLSECLYIHPRDLPEFKRANTYSLLLGKVPIELPAQPRFFGPDLEARLREAGLGLRHLPGHTAGSCVFFTADKKLLFCGDTILNNRIHQVNPFFENRSLLREAVGRIESDFLPETVVFPGHGAVTWLKTELQFNPKLLEIRRAP